jgi:hypothetical protein
MVVCWTRGALRTSTQPAKIPPGQTSKENDAKENRCGLDGRAYAKASVLTGHDNGDGDEEQNSKTEEQPRGRTIVALGAAEAVGAEFISARHRRDWRCLDDRTAAGTRTAILGDASSRGRPLVREPSPNEPGPDKADDQLQ